MISVEEKRNIAVSKWMLMDIKQIYALKDRGVYCAESEQYGSVILKISQDLKSISCEYQMLKERNGDHCCKVYEWDEDNGMFLEEKLIPGVILRKERDRDIRIKEFVRVFNRIHDKPSDQFYFDSYLDWLNRACTNLRIIKNAGILADKIIIAKNIGIEIFEKYSERVLLHGDLHHDNILLTLDGSYSIIDPKGVIGPAICDVQRFIMNELYNNSAKNDHIYYVIKKISDLLKYPEKDLKKLFFMEVILANAWYIEDGEEPNLDDIKIATAIFISM